MEENAVVTTPPPPLDQEVVGRMDGGGNHHQNMDRIRIVVVIIWYGSINWKDRIRSVAIVDDRCVVLVKR